MIPREFGLEDKIALVTGGGKSIGRACALALAELGANVVVVGRERQPLDRVADEIQGAGREGLAIVCDVAEASDVEHAFAQAADRFGRVDVAVANAGVFQEWLPSEDVPLAEWDRVIGIDLRGVMLTCRHAGESMIRAGAGSIITISSIAGVAALPNTLAYTAAKSGVIGVTRSLATDWAKHGIRVNCVAPGFIARDDEPLRDDPDVLQMIMSRASMRRWGESREIALSVAFLASPAASFITGAVLAVDGGWLAR